MSTMNLDTVRKALEALEAEFNTETGDEADTSDIVIVIQHGETEVYLDITAVEWDEEMERIHLIANVDTHED